MVYLVKFTLKEIFFFLKKKRKKKCFGIDIELI